MVIQQVIHQLKAISLATIMELNVNHQQGKDSYACQAQTEPKYESGHTMLCDCDT